MLPLQSPEIDQITQAFIKAMSEFEEFKEDTTGPFKNISIASMRSATKKALKDNGLCIKHGCTYYEGQALSFIKLSHVSGQWEYSYYTIYPEENNPKKLGSNQLMGVSYSYQRRYALYGLFGIKGEDNDPDDMMPSHNQRPVQKKEIDHSKMVGPATENQIKMIRHLIDNDRGFENKLIENCNVLTLSELTKSQASQIISRLKDE